MTFRRDERAVSVTVTHVLTIGITAVLVTGLLVGAGDLLQRQQDRAIEQGLRDIGDGIVNDLTSVDRLAAAGATGNVSARLENPEQVGGETYTVDLLVQDRQAVLYLNTSGGHAEPFVFQNQTDVCPGAASSGDVVVRYDADAHGGDGCLRVDPGGA